MEDATYELSDLVVRLEGRRNRRFRSCFVDGDDPHYWDGFIGEDEYTEWRLRRRAGEMLDLLDRAPQAADVLLQNLLLSESGGCCKVVWFSDMHVVLCEGPGAVDGLPDCDLPEHHLEVWSNDPVSYTLTLKTLEDHDPYDEDEAGRALHLLHKLVALGTCVHKVDMRFGGETLPENVPGVQDFVSLARSRRTVQFNDGVSTQVGRILAYHCGPMVELETLVGDWEDEGAALANALLAGRGPSRLALGCLRGDSSSILAPALRATTCVKELTILLPTDEAVVWYAVGRNRGIRVLAARLIGYIGYRDLKAFWKAALTNGALHRIDASVIEHGLRAARFEKDRVKCTEMIGKMIRSNRRIASIQYDPRAYDARIMASRVLPIVHLNRFRPLLEATFDDRSNAAAAAGRDHAVDLSTLIGSSLVHSHPELLYALLKAGRDYLQSTPAKKRGRG